MQSFQDNFETRKRSFISAFSICMTLPLILCSRSQLGNLTKKEWIEQLLQISDISCQLKAINDRSDAGKHGELESDLLITKNCNTLLHQQIIKLERNAVTNVQYHWRESLEVNLVPVVRCLL